jgi:hypothetical protein
MYASMFAGAALLVATRARANGVAQRDIADYPGSVSSTTAAEVTIPTRDDQLEGAGSFARVNVAAGGLVALLCVAVRL